MDDMIDMNNIIDNTNEKKAMKKVMESMFAVNDMTLYLDTHPQDSDAISLHKQYVKEYNEAKKYYEENFGPLTIYANMSKWKWEYDKWPWEGGVN